MVCILNKIHNAFYIFCRLQNCLLVFSFFFCLYPLVSLQTVAVAAYEFCLLWILPLPWSLINSLDNSVHNQNAMGNEVLQTMQVVMGEESGESISFSAQVTEAALSQLNFIFAFNSS